MEPTNPPAPPQRIIRNAAHFHQLEAEARAAALNGANAGNCDDFPEDDDDAQVALVDQMLEAMANTAGVIDNVNEDLDDNSDVKAIRDLPRDIQEKMAWRALFKVRDVQRGIHNPDILTARFPDFMSRWKAFVALVRSSKAGCTDLFAASYMDRYTANPVMELDTKLSNNNTNKNKDYNSEIKAARHHGRIVTKLDDRAEIRDASGALIETLMKPRKRVLSEFLDPELAQSPVAKVKRARGSRRGTGTSASPVATFATPANGGSPAEGAGTNPLPPIQEEEEPFEHHQANSASAPVDDHHSNAEHFNTDLSNAVASNVNLPLSNVVPNNINPPLNNAAPSNVNPPSNNAVPSNINHSNAILSNGDLNNTEHLQAGHAGAEYLHVHPYYMPHPAPVYQTPNQHATLDQLGANAGWATSQQAPANPARVFLGTTVDPSLEDHQNTNGGSQAGSGGAALSQAGKVIQNGAGANWWVEDSSSDEVE